MTINSGWRPITSARATSSWRVYAEPTGLPGLVSTRTRDFGVIAAASRSGVSLKPEAASVVTGDGCAPAMATR